MTLKHFHTYESITGGRWADKYFRCIAPECSHYIFGKLLIGKKALCICGNVFTVTAEKLRRKKLKCDNCKIRTGFANAQDDKTVDAMIKAIINTTIKEEGK